MIPRLEYNQQIRGRKMGRRQLQAAVLAGALVLSPALAGAHSLTDVLIAAYRNSNLLAASRAGLRAQDETVAQAGAGLKPTVDLSGQGTLAINTLQGDLTDTWQAGLTANLVLYDSGRTPAAIASAEAAIMASRAGLKAAEQGVLLGAVAAYMDVRRDLEVVSLSRNNLRVLKEQVDAVNGRFAVGEVTRTDVSQTLARLAASEAGLAAAEGALAISSQNFLAAVGLPPNDLEAPPPIPDLPGSLADAIAIALGQHPSIAAARHAQDAAAHDFERARGASGPTVSLSGQLGVQINDPVPDTTVGGASATLGAVMPLYQGGTLDSLERQAMAVLDQRKFELQDTARQVQQAVAIAWANLGIARAQIAASREQIEASQVAWEGVSVEATLGARTTLDVLNAEQELLTARSALVSAQRDEYVAAYNLLSSMGLLTVAHLRLGIPSYDPDVNYDKVRTGPVEGFDGSVLDRITNRWQEGG
jgi:outer membrane protein